MRLSVSLALLLTVLLSGCATRSNTPVTGLPSWQERASQASAASEWRLEARVATRQDDEAMSFTVQWHQIQDSYDIRMFGPMGQGAVEIAGNAEQVVLSRGRDTWTDTSPESLLYRHADLFLPVSDLQFWIRGLPAPGTVTGLKRDSTGQPLMFRQHGWQIEYSRYQAELPGLPEKIRISSDNGKTGSLVRVSRYGLYDLTMQP